MRGWIVALLVSGCAVAREDFSETLATAYCDRAEQCDEIEESREQCQEDASALIEFIVDAREVLDFRYDPVQGGVCVRHVRSLECDELTGWSDDDECDVTVAEQ